MICDYMCTLYSHQNIKFIKNSILILTTFVNNSLMVNSIYFGEDKTKNILLKRGKKFNLPLTITRNENFIKQHSVVE